MGFNWINGENFDINCLLMMEDFLLQNFIRRSSDEAFKYKFSVILNEYKHLQWCFKTKCPEKIKEIDEIIAYSQNISEEYDLKKIEKEFIEDIDSDVVYVYPEVMETLDYITGWDEHRLTDVIDLKGKRVLDLGSGTGRLGFTAAKYAKSVYACEPVQRLREHLRMKKEKLNVDNLYVSDGVIENIPYEDDFFDVIISGHVMGDNYQEEYKELVRVLKDGGSIVDCPGEDHRKRENPSKDMVDLGFQWKHYVSKFEGDVYIYWKKVSK